MDLPIELVEEIVGNLDYVSIARFSATCKKYKHFSKIPRRQMRRMCVLRASKIYSILKTFTEEDVEDIEDFLDFSLQTSFVSSVYKEFGPRTATVLLSTLLDAYEMSPPIPRYRKHDPELYDIITEDMRMRAPPDVGLIWNFYSKVYLKI